MKTHVIPKITMCVHLITTKSSDKENILKATREKRTSTYMGNPIRLAGDFSAELERQKKVAETLTVLTGKLCRQEYPTQRGCHSEQEERECVSQMQNLHQNT